MNPQTKPIKAVGDGSDCNNNNSDDEFFGSQEEYNDDDEQQQQQQHPCESFGDMGKHDQRAKHHELKTAGFLDAFDESKEEQLQEGFEAGFLESFEAGRAIGQLLGRASTTAILLHASSSSQTTTATEATAATTNSTSRRANELVHRFFANEFQTNRDPGTVRDDLDRLVAKTQSFLVEAE
jgi:hypothetical protein